MKLIDTHTHTHTHTYKPYTGTRQTWHLEQRLSADHVDDRFGFVGVHSDVDVQKRNEETEVRDVARYVVRQQYTWRQLAAQLRRYRSVNAANYTSNKKSQSNLGRGRFFPEPRTPYT